VDNDDIARLTTALRTVGAELDALSHRVQALEGAPAPALAGCTGSCPHAERYREALRDAVRALERSRTSFKSKELGELRRSLESLLFEASR
jgi:hypothetical protein